MAQRQQRQQSEEPKEPTRDPISGWQVRRVRVPGWYPQDISKDRRKDVVGEGLLDNIRLGSKYIWSIRDFMPFNLEVTNELRYAGGFFTPIVTYGVIDLSERSLNMFFVAEETAKELSLLVEHFTAGDIILGSSKRFRR
jgi:hypothetical protein